MKIDLKDGFFSIPVSDELSRFFGFSWGVKRYKWTRVPQGWLWSSILFHERIAEIFRGLGVVQYVDDLLIGGRTPREVWDKALKVFERLEEYGLKVNYNKMIWLSRSVKFLGYQLEGGELSLRKYLQEKKKAVGEISSIKGLERIIGVLSYCRHAIWGIEDILGQLRDD